MSLSNVQRSVIPQLKIVVFYWKEPIPKEALSISQLSDSIPLDISEWVPSCNFQKSLSSPAGNFTFTLENDRDWKRIIKPGQWALLYMTNDGDLPFATTEVDLGATGVVNSKVKLADSAFLKTMNGKLRGICHIDRISSRGEINENGSLDVKYEVSGRDFGIVYEETTIWHNFFRFEAGLLDAASTSLKYTQDSTVDKLMDVMHRLFFSPKSFPALNKYDPKDKDNQTISQVGLQWLMPKELLTALNLSLTDSDSFYGNISGVRKFIPTKLTNPIENPLTQLNGNAWEKLKSLSIQQFHELFTETTDDGRPQLVFRPIPWKLNGKAYPLLANTVDGYLDLALGNDRLNKILNGKYAPVSLDTVNIISFDLGEDGHNRYNHFLTTVEATLYKTTDNISDLQSPSAKDRKFPYPQLSSIFRNGFRPMHVEVNSMVQFGQQGATPYLKLLVDANELIFDYWNTSIYFESGSTQIIGNNSVKCGKALLFSQDAPYNSGKVFYIEGYSDEFTVDANGSASWVQNIQITRGAELETVKKIANDDSDASLFRKGTEFQDAGSFTPKTRSK